MHERNDRGLLPMDFPAVAYLLVVTAIVVVCRARIDGWIGFAAAHAVLAIGVVGLAAWSRDRGWLGHVRLWYPVLLVPLVFKLNVSLVPRVSPNDRDAELLDWDRALFGDHPAVFLGWMEAAWVTDILRVCWMSYFVLPFLVAIPLYHRAIRSAKPRPFRLFVFALTTGWFVSYIGYFLVPALGPGYFPDAVGVAPAHTDGATDAMLATLWTLEGERARDIFPSGHVIIALLSLWGAFRFRLAIRWLLVPLVVGLVLGTIYLRFHYGVDVIAGAVIAAGIIAVARLSDERPRAA